MNIKTLQDGLLYTTALAAGSEDSNTPMERVN